MRPQWEIDAIDAMEDARQWRRTLARLAAFERVLTNQPKVKKGRGQRRNRRNKR